MDFMTNLQTNALRIIELLYPDIDINGIEKYKDFFSSYNGLMPIVFECNNNTNMEIHIYPPTVQLLEDKKYVFGYKDNLNKSEPEFIEALQLAVIKYLEIKNDE